MKLRIPEKVVQAGIQDYLWARRIKVRRINVVPPPIKDRNGKLIGFRKNGVNSMNGVSDLIGIYKTRFLAIEVKSPNNSERPAHQIEYIDEINSEGGMAFFADSVKAVEWNLLVRDPEFERLSKEAA